MDGLDKCLLGSGDNLVLYLLSQIDEVGAVACYSHHQVNMTLGMLLCIQEFLPVHNIELDMVDAKVDPGPEIGSDEPLLGA